MQTIAGASGCLWYTFQPEGPDWQMQARDLSPLDSMCRQTAAFDRHRIPGIRPRPVTKNTNYETKIKFLKNTLVYTGQNVPSATRKILAPKNSQNSKSGVYYRWDGQTAQSTCRIKRQSDATSTDCCPWLVVRCLRLRRD